MSMETNNYQRPSVETVSVATEGVLCEAASIVNFKMENETWEW